MFAVMWLVVLLLLPREVCLGVWRDPNPTLEIPLQAGHLPAQFHMS